MALRSRLVNKSSIRITHPVGCQLDCPSSFLHPSSQTNGGTVTHMGSAAPPTVPGQRLCYFVCPDRCALRERVTCPKWVAAAIVSIFLVSAGAPAEAEVSYDPRTWSYDRSRNVLISPSELGTGTAHLRDWAPIPRETVYFNEPLPKGSIVIDTSERRLYYVLGNGRALRYAAGVGREGFSWSGRDRISSKRHWPDWRPPAEMRSREAASGHFLPAHMKGGPDNPLGARALYIGNTLYRIHGTN